MYVRRLRGWLLVKVPKQVGKKVTFKEEPIYQGYIYCHLKMNAEVRAGCFRMC